MRLSNRTSATLIDVVSAAYSHSELDNLFLRLGCAGVGPARDLSSKVQGPNKLDRVRPVVDCLSSRQHEPDVVTLVRELIEVRFKDHVFEYDGRVVPFLEPLVRELAVDGYAVDEAGQLVATTPTPAALGPQLSLLQQALDARGLRVAGRHYREAVESYVDGRLEASNGQLRSFIEDLMLSLCEEFTGMRPSTARGAAEKLRNKGHLDADEATLISGLAGISNERGAHAGLTDPEEALFRLHSSTALAKYLLARLS